MSKHSHEHGHQHDHKHHTPSKRPPHKDWRLWVAVGLMLAAMIGYVLSMDESIEPGSNTERPEVPAAP